MGSPSPVKGVAGVGTLTGVVEIVSGLDMTCALLTTSGVVCWGANDYGQLGNGTSTGSSTPTQVVGFNGVGTLSNVTQISTNGFHTCVVLVDSSVGCWGWNGTHDLGNGTTTNSPFPVHVQATNTGDNFTGASAVSASTYGTCALMVDHTVKCWGSGVGAGRLTTSSNFPVSALAVDGNSNLSGVAAIAGSNGTMCALVLTAKVVCWGGNVDGLLANGTDTLIGYVPTYINDPAGSNSGGIVAIGGSNSHICIVRLDDSIACWGGNIQGWLGIGTTAVARIPTNWLGFPRNESLAPPTGFSARSLANGIVISHSPMFQSTDSFVVKSIGGNSEVTGSCSEAMKEISCTINSLIDDTPVIPMIAIESNGQFSSWTALPRLFPSFPPSQVSGVNVSPNATGALIKWNRALGTGSPVTNYQARAFDSKGKQVAACNPSGTYSPSCTLTGLKTGLPYSVNVIAYSGNRQSVPSRSQIFLPSSSPVLTSPTTYLLIRGEQTSFDVSLSANADNGIQLTGAMPPGIRVSSIRLNGTSLSGTPTVSGNFTLTGKVKKGKVITSQSIRIVVVDSLSYTFNKPLVAGITSSAVLLTTPTVPACFDFVIGLPYWATAQCSSTGMTTISGNPPPGSGGTYALSIYSRSIVSTSLLLQLSTVQLVVNESPELHVSCPASLTFGQDLSLPILTSGGYPGDLTISATGLPVWLSLSKVDGSHSLLTGKPTTRGKLQIAIIAQAGSLSTKASCTLNIS
jgi:alpha-tubulin suppressor-like RCC1 family protein